MRHRPTGSKEVPANARNHSRDPEPVGNHNRLRVGSGRRRDEEHLNAGLPGDHGPWGSGNRSPHPRYLSQGRPATEEFRPGLRRVPQSLGYRALEEANKGDRPFFLVADSYDQSEETSSRTQELPTDPWVAKPVRSKWE